MRIAIVWFAIAGVLAGGAIAFARQRKPWWSIVLLLLVAAGVAWFGWLNLEAAR